MNSRIVDAAEGCRVLILLAAGDVQLVDLQHMRQLSQLVQRQRLRAHGVEHAQDGDARGRRRAGAGARRGVGADEQLDAVVWPEAVDGCLEQVELAVVGQAGRRQAG